MEKIDILKEFKDNLKRLDSDIGSMYHHLFKIIPEHKLINILEYWRTQFMNDKENWFYHFHKSIRQTDFYDLNVYQRVNNLTEEQKNRRVELLQIRMKMRYNKGDDTLVDMDDNTLKQYTEYGNELFELNRIMYTEEELRISGHLDMLLWNTIHLDQKNELKSILERTFKVCS